MKLALDDGGSDRLVRALRQRFRTPADMLTALGIDQGVLEEEEGERTMRTRDARSRDQEMMSELGPDRRSRDRGRDEEDPEEEREIEELMAMLRDMPTEDRRTVMDWARGRAPAYDQRRMSRDQPSPFAGMPEPGGTMFGSTDWSERQARDYRRGREARDRRGRAFAADMAARDDSFAAMFPDAMRIRTTGF